MLGLIADELQGIITKFVALRLETYGYLTGDSNENKRAKGT